MKSEQWLRGVYRMSTKIRAKMLTGSRLFLDENEANDLDYIVVVSDEDYLTVKQEYPGEDVFVVDITKPFEESVGGDGGFYIICAYKIHQQLNSTATIENEQIISNYVNEYEHRLKERLEHILIKYSYPERYKISFWILLADKILTNQFNTMNLEDMKQLMLRSRTDNLTQEERDRVIELKVEALIKYKVRSIFIEDDDEYKLRIEEYKASKLGRKHENN